MFAENQVSVKVKILVWTQYVFHLPVYLCICSFFNSFYMPLYAYMPNIVFGIPMIPALRSKLSLFEAHVSF